MSAYLGQLPALAGVFFAGAISGATGLAFPLIAGPIFLRICPPPQAVALTAMCSLTGQLFSVGLLRRSIKYEFRFRLVASGLIAVPVGSALINTYNPYLARLALGALIAVSGFWGLSQPEFRISRPASGLSEILVGLAGGLTGGLVGASSVVPAIWCAVSGLDKCQQRAITQPFILAMPLASVSLWSLGSLDRSVSARYFEFLPPLLAGVCVGVAGFGIVSSNTVTKTVMLIVTVSGCARLFN